MTIVGLLVCDRSLFDRLLGTNAVIIRSSTGSHSAKHLQSSTCQDFGMETCSMLAPKTLEIAIELQIVANGLVWMALSCIKWSTPKMKRAFEGFSTLPTTSVQKSLALILSPRRVRDVSRIEIDGELIDWLSWECWATYMKPICYPICHRTD